MKPIPMRNVIFIFSFILLAMLSASCDENYIEKPITTNIIVDEDKDGSKFILKLQTERIYTCVNYEIEHTVTQKNDSIFIIFDRITAPSGCLSAAGRATGNANLGELNNNSYIVHFSFLDRNDDSIGILNTTNNTLSITEGTSVRTSVEAD